LKAFRTIVSMPDTDDGRPVIIQEHHAGVQIGTIFDTPGDVVDWNLTLRGYYSGSDQYVSAYVLAGGNVYRIDEDGAVLNAGKTGRDRIPAVATLRDDSENGVKVGEPLLVTTPDGRHKRTPSITSVVLATERLYGRDSDFATRVEERTSVMDQFRAMVRDVNVRHLTPGPGWTI
jgi:hypothetical protein